MNNMKKAAIVALVISVAGYAYAGPTAHLGKELTKGVTEQVKKEASGMDVEKGARDVTSGVVEGVSGHGRDIDKGARDLGRAMAQGFFLELRAEMGSDGKGPLATSMANAGEQGARQLVRGLVDEVAPLLPACQGQDRAACLDALVQRYAYESSKSAAKGAADGAPPWTTVLTASAGFAGGLLVSAFIALLVGQRRTRRELTGLRARTA
ncbi:MAG TPA: hypothetical protein VIA18_00875 [Polyangia bacterium]|nr:hypothetical protein [Polyangia bacterium]